LSENGEPARLITMVIERLPDGPEILGSGPTER
jgi:hypothetical protein